MYADLALKPRAHRLDLDDGAGQGHVERLLVAAADGQADAAADGAAHLLHRLRELHALHLLAVDLGDQVARLDAGARRPGVSSIGETTLTMPFSMVTSMPRPPNWPCVCTFISSKRLAFI